MSYADAPAAGFSTAPRNLVLKSSDGAVFEVEAAAAKESLTIKNMIDDDCAAGVIPLPNVTGRILAKVMEFCRKRAEFVSKLGHGYMIDRNAEVDFKAWEKGFIDGVDRATLRHLILAAHYLDIKSLLDLTCMTIADMIKGKTPEEIRAILNIQNDTTPEEEEEFRKENKWVFGK